jgi:hypothetical protein
MAFSATGVLIIFGSIILSFSDTPAPFTSDNEILDRTKALQEVNLFLEKYPDATAGVGRGSEIEVRYVAMRTNMTDVRYEDRTEPILILTVFLRSNLQAWQTSLYCSSPFDSSDDFGQINNTDIIPFLMQNKDEQCLD